MVMVGEYMTSDSDQDIQLLRMFRLKPIVKQFTNSDIFFAYYCCNPSDYLVLGIVDSGSSLLQYFHFEIKHGNDNLFKGYKVNGATSKWGLKAVAFRNTKWVAGGDIVKVGCQRIVPLIVTDAKGYSMKPDDRL